MLMTPAEAEYAAPPPQAARAEALERLSGFRTDFHGCLTGYGDALFELTDAALCVDGPVRSPVELTLAAEHRRRHGGMYKAPDNGATDVASFQTTPAGLPLPRVGGRIVLAVDVSPWLRPDAPTSPDRTFCHTHGRGKNKAQTTPGWAYSFVGALESGPTGWVALLDAVRLRADDDATEVTARRVRELVARLTAAGRWKPGDPDILIVFDSGYDVTRPAFLLADPPVQLIGRIKSNRLFRLPPAPKAPGSPGRTRRHGAEFKCDKPETHPAPDAATVAETARYGRAVASAWDRLHPEPTRRSAWKDHDGELPIVEGAVVRLKVDRLPGDRADPAPMWLWSSAVGADPACVDRIWHAYLRRFDIEHTFRLLKRTLGWTRPKVRSPEAADLWTWLLLAAHARLRLARGPAEDLRRPWERRAAQGRLSPARVRRGFRNIRPAVAQPAGAPKPSRPGPGRPPGSVNARRAVRHPVGKNIETDTTPTAGEKQAG
jgi:hypothetical protein